MLISYCSETRILVKLRKAINSQDVLKFQQAIAIRKISNTFIIFLLSFHYLPCACVLAHTATCQRRRNTTAFNFKEIKICIVCKGKCLMAPLALAFMIFRIFNIVGKSCGLELIDQGITGQRSFFILIKELLIFFNQVLYRQSMLELVY